MGRVTSMLEFARAQRGDVKTNDVKVDRGGGDNRTLDHFADAGDDSFPLPQDFVATIGQDGTGRESAVGYVDPKNEQKSTAGDKRIYARDPETGLQVVEVWLKSDGTASTENENGSVVLAPDGSITGANANGSFQLQAGGDFVVNGVTIDKDGKVTIPASLMLAGKEINGHDHDILSGSSAPGPTGENN